MHKSVDTIVCLSLYEKSNGPINVVIQFPGHKSFKTLYDNSCDSHWSLIVSFLYTC